MSITSKTIGTLNDLIELNNDRIAGFEKAMSDINQENVDLKELFQKFAADSRKFSQELTAIVATQGGEPETGNSASGTLHRVWIDVKAIFGGSDRKSILAEAERGEDAIKKAYQDALIDGELSGNALETVREQSTAITAGHDAIKALRDAHK
ncbi:PA2169 family four-helix-bundle protein [Chitinophaga horti]|uniref:PA2169 family four-helix-bundle protein n=1 Tax=Chitinophaga horti TaxID=2920382 RepID=A0ABY6J5U6_9BACT|nr:PA2169 family four-helix-bundle protein [Chitinophaga horti]UYQ94992.1 PA2169 family four-helix-bundle protein [Chitinophaga horti]